MMKLIDMRTVTGHTNTPVQVADVIHFGAQLPVSIPLDDYMVKTYGANWGQDADSLRSILENGDAMVFNQSGVEQADEAERTISAGTQKLIDAGCLDAKGNLIPYKSTGRRETPLSAEDVTDYYGEDGYEF